MEEITIKVPKDIKDIVADTSETIYIEALKEVAIKRISYTQQELAELTERTRFLEVKHGKSYEDFIQNIPDTMEGHDDWIEWTYLTKAADELSNKIQKLRLLSGKC